MELYVLYRTHITIIELKVFGSFASKLKIRWNKSVGATG